MMSDWVKVSDELPPDDRPVLAVVAYRDANRRTVVRASFARKFQLPVSVESETCDFGDYDEATDEYYCPEGWYETNEFEETNWLVHEDVTHWMPLPKMPPREDIMPPASEAEQQATLDRNLTQLEEAPDGE